jgi:hypothetical protein
MLGRMGTSAREAPVPTVLLEGFIGAGQVAFAGMAEESDPGNPVTRITAELLGGVGAQVIGNPITTLATQFPNIRGTLRNVKAQYDAGGLTAALSPIQRGRQTQAVNRILEILEAEGEDVNAVIERLASNDLSNLLVDEAGRPIPLTAGAKAGSPALLAIEASIGPTWQLARSRPHGGIRSGHQGPAQCHLGDGANGGPSGTATGRRFG